MSDHALDDVEARVRLLLPDEEAGQPTSKQKKPERQSLYSYCKKEGLGEVASKFGISAKQLGANLQRGFVVSVDVIW
jgi:transcription elongation factor SPT6